MKTIVITSQKGGSGKTTVVAHLAVAVEKAGHGPAVVIDTDPQQTLATWWKVREAEAPKLAPVSLRELPDKLEALAQMGFAYCFIDTPPALTEQNRKILKLADLVGPEPEFASWAAICDGMKWPPAGSSLLTSRFGASSRHFSLLQKRILSMKRHRDEHDLGERWSWTHDEFDLLRNRTDSGPITT